MPARNLGERKSLPAADDVGFDEQGYVLALDADGKVVKADANAEPIGVNYVSTRGHGRHGSEEVRTGVEVAVIHDGYPNVLCEAGTYSGGDAVYVSQNDDGYVNTDDVDGGAKVGTVVPGAGKDADAGDLLQIDITSNLGEQ